MRTTYLILYSDFRLISESNAIRTNANAKIFLVYCKYIVRGYTKNIAKAIGALGQFLSINQNNTINSKKEHRTKNVL